MLSAIVAWSIRARRAVLVGLALLILCGIQAARSLPIDALPDASTIQVAVLTSAPGLSPLEIERTVTMPIEVALNGTPGGVELRSVSRSGLSAVTVIFADGTDVWFARQLVLERLRGIELPPSAQMPELAPVSTGLGEIYQFVVRSEHHSPMQLRTLLDWEIVPRLRSVPGVVEVNTMGGELKQFHVVVDRVRLEARGLSLHDVIDALAAANVSVGGGYVERNKESFTVRGEGLLKDIKDIGKVVVKTTRGAAPVLIRHVAEVQTGTALRYGVITQAGTGEAVTGVVMMLLGANSKQVVSDVATRVQEVQKDLPAGVRIEVVYDRADFVKRTLSTVVKNLLEGVAIVSVILVLFLGSLRAAIAVVLGVPAAMSIAIFGMHLFGVTGDLMSLGAIDFGFLVDGPIVIVESVIAATAGRKLLGAARARAYDRVAKGVARPVAFAVAIIMLVYVPLLSLEGVEGKMFRPMALTMASALFGAFVYSIIFFPAVLVAIVPPAKGHGPVWIQWISTRYERMVPQTLRLRWPVLATACAALVVSGWLFGRSGAEFLPRIFEGDAVVTIRRAPSVSLDEARRLDIETERVLQGFPEVITTIGQTGRAEVAVDPVGNDNTDLLTRLKPIEQWKTAQDFDELSERFKVAIENRVPGTYVSVSQPIEDRTNEIISGSRADVQIQLFGTSLEVLTDYAGRIGKVIRTVAGTGDVRVERILGAPMISATADRDMLARYGVELRDAFDVVQAAREGVRVGSVFEQERRVELRVLMPPTKPTAAALGDLFVRTVQGESIPLNEVVTLTESEGPTAIRRENRRRAVRVDVNLRGRDLLSWVEDARVRVSRELQLPKDYDLTWGGQFENFQRAQARLAIVLPVVVAIIFGMLLWMFQNWRFALAAFTLVPLSLTGGMIGLLLSGLPFSLPAAVGFIALGGIAVLNGVVVASDVRHRLDEGVPLDLAICRGSAHSLRAVLTTATVAALGFLPMAVATSAGAEIQRPLARVVVVGMLFGTMVTVFVLPGLLRTLLKGYVHYEDADETANEGIYVATASIRPSAPHR
jgi:cobalt-zinc-cadmium resistance protein CzcA